MATETIPTWDESEEIKTPTWEESSEFKPPTWEESEPHVPAIGKLPPSRFGADIQAPVDFAGGAAIEAPFAPAERFARNPLQATPPENGESLQPLVKAKEAPEYLAGAPQQPTVAESQLALQPPPQDSTQITPEQAEQGNVEAVAALGKAVEPLAKLPKLTREKILKSAAAFAGNPGIGIEAAVPEITQEMINSPLTKNVTGASNAVLESLDFFTSPLGIATLGSGVLPKLAQRGIALAFVADMARHAPDQLEEFLIAKHNGDQEGMAKSLTSMGLTAAFVVGGVKHGVEGVPGEIADRVMSKVPRGAGIGSPEPLRPSTETKGPETPLAPSPITKGTPAAPVTPEVQEFIDRFNSPETVNNNHTRVAGLAVKTIDDLEALKAAQIAYNERVAALKAELAKQNAANDPQAAKTQDALFALIGRNQFLRETVETATKTGSWKPPMNADGTDVVRPLDWSTNPTVQKWLIENGSVFKIEPKDLAAIKKHYEESQKGGESNVTEEKGQTQKRVLNKSDTYREIREVTTAGGNKIWQVWERPVGSRVRWTQTNFKTEAEAKAYIEAQTAKVETPAPKVRKVQPYTEFDNLLRQHAAELGWVKPDDALVLSQGRAKDLDTHGVNIAISKRYQAALKRAREQVAILLGENKTAAESLADRTRLLPKLKALIEEHKRKLAAEEEAKAKTEADVQAEDENIDYTPDTGPEGETLFRKKKHQADQFELPGQEGAFNLAGEKVEGEQIKPKAVWEMTRSEYVKLAHEKDPTLRDRIARGIAAAEPETLHRMAVEKALREGQPVPPEVLADYPKLKKPVPPEQEELFQTKKAADADAIFDRAEVGDEAAFDELHDRLSQQYPDTDELRRFGRGDPNTVHTAAEFEKLFEEAFKARDFDRILNAIKATSDVTVWKPLLQKFFKAQKTDPQAAIKADWMRAVFNGTRPDGALPPKPPKPPPETKPPPTGTTGGKSGTKGGGSGTKPPPGGTPPPGGGTRPPPRPPPAAPPPRIEAAPIRGGTPKSPYQILKDFSKAIGKALDVRKQRPNVLGTYHPGSTLTTVRFASDLDSAAHELAGHWTDDRYGIGKRWVNSRTPSPYDTELAKFWIHGSYRPGMSRRMARAEGIAEYIRAYVVNPDAARASAPNFTAYFESSIPARALNAIKAFGTDVRTWVGADPILRSTMEFRRNPPSFTEKLWDTLRGEGHGFFVSPIDRLRLWFDDSLHYAMKAQAQIRKLHGRDLTPEQDFEILARLLPSHDARMSDQLENGLVEFRTRQIQGPNGRLAVSRPLDPVTQKPMSLPWLLEGFDRSNREAFLRDMADTSAFMVHQRTLEKARQLGRPENISGMGAGIMTDTQVARQFMAALEQNPALKARLEENARRYRLWADHNLQMLVDSGRLSRDAYRRIKRDNEQYVAMQRLSEEFNVAHGGKSSNAVGTPKQVIKRFRGSSLQIGNVYENLLEQTNAIQKESFRNAAMRSFVDGLINVRKLHEPNRLDLAQFGSRATSRDPNTIKVFRDGNVEYWKFDHDIHENLKGLGDLGSHKFIEILSMPSTFTRYMITHGPQFMLRNPIRDTFERSVVSNNGSKPWDILKGYSQDELSRYNVFGGGQFGNYIVDKHVWNKEIERVTRELVKDPRNIIYSPLKLKHAWEQLAQNSESVGRVAEFRRAFEKGKQRGLDDYNAALYAASEARGLLDFAKAGTVMRVINRLVPFSNARIRGLARSAFQIRNKPGSFAMNWGLFVLAPVLATWLWNRKDKETWDEYQQLPAYQKDFYWNFKVGNQWLRIPRPHELGVMAGGVERALNRIMGDKRALEGYGKSTASSILPVGDPVELTGPIRTWLELEFNRDTFRNRDIVPSWEKDLKLEKREGVKHASDVGKSLAAVLNTTGMGADPRQVDYFLNSLGGLGQIATTATSPTRTIGELASKATGYQSDVPASGARDVQWVLQWAKENGFTQHRVIDNLKKLREDVLNEPSPAARNEKAKALRYYATELRVELEKYDEQQAKAKKAP